MTIREHYQVMSNRIKYGAVALAVALAVFAGWRYPTLTSQQLIVPSLMVGAVFGLVIGIIGRLVYRCPRCGAYMNMKGQTSIRPEAAMFWDRWAACPRCHVSFDDPYRV